MQLSNHLFASSQIFLSSWFTKNRLLPVCAFLSLLLWSSQFSFMADFIISRAPEPSAKVYADLKPGLIWPGIYKMFWACEAL